MNAAGRPDPNTWTLEHLGGIEPFSGLWSRKSAIVKGTLRGTTRATIRGTIRVPYGDYKGTIRGAIRVLGG